MTKNSVLNRVIETINSWIEKYKNHKERQRELMREKYGECKVDGCSESLLPVGPNSGKCPKHVGVQSRDRPED